LPDEGILLEELAEFAMNYAESLGAEYAEARFQCDVQESIMLKNGIPEAVILEEK